jgi:hypothetical protein
VQVARRCIGCPVNGQTRMESPTTHVLSRQQPSASPSYLRS